MSIALARAAPLRGLISLNVGVAELWALASLAAAFILTLGVTSFTLDTWWGLKMGQISVETGRPATDVVLSFAPADPSAANVAWLGQVVVYSVYRATGEGGLRVVAGLLVLAAYGALLAASRAHGASPRAMAVGAAVALAITAQNLGMRTQIIAFPIFTFTYFLLRQRHQRPGLLLLLPPILFAWVNLHGSWPLGLLLVGLFTLEEVLRFAAGLVGLTPAPPRSCLTRLLPAFVGSVLAVCLNPLGPAVFGYLFSITTNPIVKEMITEWQPATIRDHAGQTLAISALLLASIARASGRPLARIDLLLLLAFGYLALGAVRNTVWWGLVLAPILARHAASISRPRWPRRFFAKQPAEPPRRPLVNLALAGLIVVVAALAPLWAPSRVGPGPASERSAGYSPVELADFLATLPENSRLFTYQGWTGYFAWRLWPRQQPMLDVRFEALTSDVWTDQRAVNQLRADWQELLDQYRIDYLVLDPRSQGRLAAAAEVSGGWSRLHQDGAGVVLGRAR